MSIICRLPPNYWGDISGMNILSTLDEEQRMK